MPCRHRTVNIEDILDHSARDLSMREFPEQYLLVLPNERHGKMKIKPSCAYEREEAKGTPASGAQSSHHDSGVDDNVWNWHEVMVERTT